MNNKEMLKLIGLALFVIGITILLIGFFCPFPVVPVGSGGGTFYCFGIVPDYLLPCSPILTLLGLVLFLVSWRMKK
jgi:hypothetical protein